MKVQPNFAYYNNITTNFKSRMRMQSTPSQAPIRSKNNPNLLVYIYEDSNTNLDINERTYDSFTGLRDKQYLLAVLNKKIDDSQKTGKNLSLAMFDMDNFKSVNELLGYETGDDFIKFIANSVDNVAKKNALSAYRFGGEEFVIIFENEDECAQRDMVDKVLNMVNSNSYIKSKEKEYEQNAINMLAVYSMQTEKINDLFELKDKKKIYEDLRENLSTEEARKDPYLLKSIKSTDDEIKTEYLTLISERLPEEEETDTKLFLFDVAERLKQGEEIDKKETEELDKYLKFRYDKSAEVFQIQKWLNDFRKNHGFSITGSTVSFRPEFIKNKTPVQLVGIAGESLKQGKHARKGRGYYSKN